MAWNSVPKTHFIAASLFTLMIFYFSQTGQHWVPLLDGANLMFHEAGHPLLGAFSNRLMVYGGTLGQLCFPLITMVYFARETQTTSFYICSIWLFQNLTNIARYLGDAREQALPLIGGGEHDWTEILSRWNALPKDRMIAGKLNFFAIIGMMAVSWWFFKKFVNSGEPVDQINP